LLLSPYMSRETGTGALLTAAKARIPCVRPKSTVRIPENGAQQPASIVVFHATNGCAAHSSHRWLTFRAATCSLLAKLTASTPRYACGTPHRRSPRRPGDLIGAILLNL